MCFVWIDIEDQADLVEEFDVENFPTILIQHNDMTLFAGTMLPEISLLDRLIHSQIELISIESQSKAKQYQLRTTLLAA